MIAKLQKPRKTIENSDFRKSAIFQLFSELDSSPFPLQLLTAGDSFLEACGGGAAAPLQISKTEGFLSMQLFGAQLAWIWQQNVRVAQAWCKIYLFLVTDSHACQDKCYDGAGNQHQYVQEDDIDAPDNLTTWCRIESKIKNRMMMFIDAMRMRTHDWAHNVRLIRIP